MIEKFRAPQITLNTYGILGPLNLNPFEDWGCGFCFFLGGGGGGGRGCAKVPPSHASLLGIQKSLGSIPKSISPRVSKVETHPKAQNAFKIAPFMLGRTTYVHMNI